MTTRAPVYPKRLIEVDLPIKRISAHARREKSIRHGHISTLHIWWARRPLASCRAVICASLWPDPADPLCPQAFRDGAAVLINDFAAKVAGPSSNRLKESCSEESLGRWLVLARPEGRIDPANPDHWNFLRYRLLDFIADFANWDNSTQPEYLETSRALTQAAHEALGGAPGTRPLVVDPFAGGGAIPLEALRVGADAFASDLNPVAVLLNKVVLEYIPKYGQRLADEVRKLGQWVKERAEEELADFYPKDADGGKPIAYLWTRTITCEGPACGAEVPLIRSMWLAKKSTRSIALRMNPDQTKKRVDFEIIEHAKEQEVADGTVRRGSAGCLCCGYTTPVASVRRQLKDRRGGTADARLITVVTTRPGQQGRFYRIPTEQDEISIERAGSELNRRSMSHTGPMTMVPEEEISLNEIRRISMPIYGMTRWGDMFSPRQALALTTLTRFVQQAKFVEDKEFGDAVRICLALALDKQADRDCSLCRWISQNENIGYTFSRQALGMMWDYVEAPFLSSGGGWTGIIDDICETITAQSVDQQPGHSECSSATNSPLPDDSTHLYFTDPPYYDAVPYAYLSDFFYVWLRRTLRDNYPAGFHGPQTSKTQEIVVDRPHRLSTSTKDIRFYESELTKAFADGRRTIRPDGIGIVVFASKTTASWEAILQAVMTAGWTITGSWPVDTERAARIAAQGQARLASSVHLVCRPRENPDGSLRLDDIGDWRDVVQELPVRIHDWMPRLADNGVVGADAIFACLGPALEIFSRYSRVEKASGEVVPLSEYLEQVWAAVAREALSVIFEGADTSGFEEDARLTAMWLWTLKSSSNGNGDGTAEDTEDGENPTPSSDHSGYALEYDAARKIAQGLGAHLEQLSSLIEVKGDTARLLPVAERARHLFGHDGGRAPSRSMPSTSQLSLFTVSDEADEGQTSLGFDQVPELGNSVLDRIHQSMLLFASGRSPALQRFLVDEGVGRDQRFWRLAQALSALYPPTTEEKRWVDGVMARKTGLGL